MGNTSKRPSQAKPPKQCQNTTINKFIPQLPSKAKQSKTNSQNEFNAQPPVLAQAPLVKKQLPPLKDDHIFEEYLELDFLPMEMFSYLISFFDLHMIVNVIPRVCKALFNEVSANGGFWKMKAQREKPPGQRKLESQTWKQFCFIGMTQ